MGGVVLLAGAGAVALVPPGLPALAAFAAAWLCLVLAMTVPSRTCQNDDERAVRIAEFRHELNAAGADPTREELERLVTRAYELEIDGTCEEVAQLRACLDAAELRERLTEGYIPIVNGFGDTTFGEVCHFVCPVRLGRRRADAFGHLLICSGGLVFRGPVDHRLTWTQVNQVRRDGRDLVVLSTAKPKPVRFRCDSYGDAARAGVMAEYLAGATTCPQQSGIQLAFP